jgi:hypothetical protein
MPQIPVAPSPDKRRCTNDGRKETGVDRAGHRVRHDRFSPPRLRRMIGPTAVARVGGGSEAITALYGLGSVGGKPDPRLAAGGRPPRSRGTRCAGQAWPTGSNTQWDGHHRGRTAPAACYRKTRDAMSRQRADAAGRIPTSPRHVADDICAPGQTPPRPPGSALSRPRPHHRRRDRPPLRFIHLGRFAAAHKMMFGKTLVQALHAAR